MIRAHEDPRTTVRGSSTSPAPVGTPLRTRLRAWLIFLAVLTACSILTFRGIVVDPGARVYAENDDTSLFIWWFANGADAVAALFGFGSDRSGFLYTTQMNWPDGVNGAWNTSVLGLAVPFAPITWLWGPVVAYTVAIVCSPIAASVAAAAFLTRFADRLPAFVGAALYGFSPYLIAQAGGHLNLSFAVLPPLVAAFLWQAATGPSGGLLRERVRALTPWGILLGGAIGWQFYMSTELLAGTFLAAVVAVLALVAVLRRRLLARLVPAVVASAAAVLTAVLFAVPLLLTMAVAPNAPSGAIRPHGVWNNDLLDPVVPTATSPFAGSAPEIPRALPIDAAEIGGYVSLAWLAVAVWAVVRHRRSARHGLLVRVLALGAVGVWLLSMGSPLRVFGVELPVPGPFRVVEQIPVLMNILPMRLSVHVALALSALTAVLLHHALRDIARQRRIVKQRRGGQGRAGGQTRVVGRSMLRAAGPVAAVAATLALIAPVGVPHRDVTIPRFFASDAVRETLPAGAVAKALPIPRAVAEADYAQAMVWQAVSGMHYRETGGYFIGGTEEHDVLYQAPLDPLDQFLRQEEGRAVEDLDRAALAHAVRATRAGGTEFVLVPEHAPLLNRDAEDLAAALAEPPGVTASLIEDVWVVDLRGIDDENGVP